MSMLRNEMISSKRVILQNKIFNCSRVLFIDFIKAHSVRYVQLHFDHMDWNTYAAGR